VVPPSVTDPGATLDSSMATTQPRTRPVARDLASDPPAVEVRDLFKDFRIPHRQAHTIKERVLHPLAHRSFDHFRALSGVSFTVQPGEFFGVVGRNGSGKSTLLKCLAGIYGVDSGDVTVRGRLSPFIELGVGFNPELAARDNIIINAVMLGLTRREAVERVEDVMGFAELEPFRELKLKNYSSGMSVRLAFSTAIQVDADVLLVDEVLAVGDLSFQRKCFDEFERLKEVGRTIVFVTHDMGAVQRFCDRALLLHRGELREVGQPASVAQHYFALNAGRLDDEEPDHLDLAPEGAEVAGAWFEDATGEGVHSLPSGEPCTLCFEVIFRERVEDPVFTLALRSPVGQSLFATSSRWEETPTGTFEALDRVIVRVSLDLLLGPGRYHLAAGASRVGGEVLASSDDAARLDVTGDREAAGLAALPHELRLQRL
jgi:ABC-type polysaccharide/polyol phosphate transport system ATPase subunit